MDASEIMLHGFAYGEDLDALGQRTLGYHLLAPAGPTAWGHEVETLARRLQAAPYPDHWPAVDLFCSILLAERKRLIAVARYGLTDHSHDRRRGGLELIGIVTTDALPVSAILSVYRWLRVCRASADNLHSLGGTISLAEVLKRSPPEPQTAHGLPDLRLGLWQDGAIVFGATFPEDPDQHLYLLELSRRASWQWLPLIGNDFPLRTYLGHGPLVAWTALSSAALPEIGDAATIAVATLGSKGRPLPHVVSVFVLEEHDARS